MQVTGFGWLAWVRSRLSARPDTEHEQALVRLAAGTVLFLYLLPEAWTVAGGEFDPSHRYLAGMLAYLAFSAAIFVGILLQPGESPARRVFAALVDIGTVTYFMALSGAHGLPLFLVYVWVTLANGFRFGPSYLLLCIALSVGGFSAVLLENEFWQAYLGVGIGMMGLMVALDVYVLSLVKRMFEALARAEAANQAKRRFISVVSHELRTPLNAIIGMADLMRDTALNREQADMLQTLRGASHVMLGLVEDVLDFSKIEAGRLTLERAEFDLHALVNSTCRILAAQAAAKGVEFVVSIMPEVPPAVRGDPHYLRQVLINLAGNAVKFTERGSVTVHVTAQEESGSGVRLKFSVRDTGLGITPEAQERIFESFMQGEQSTTRRFGGTGLGTTIAKQLVELMGGRIGLESALGLGSTFWFEVPLDKQPEQPGARTGELAGARILLVGFPEAHRLAIEQALTGWGAVSVAVGNVEDGVARLVAEISRAKPYHSALIHAVDGEIDLGMRFRHGAPDPAPPLVLATPVEGGIARFDALSAGFTTVLELPFDKRQLFNVLHTVSARDDVREGVIRLQDYARQGGSVRKFRLLVADDNPTNREVLGRILERAGHVVVQVADGEQALDAVEREPFDLLLLDRNMPGLGGIEVVRALRAMQSASERIPALIVSADVTPEGRRECLEAGADGFLGKPVEAIRLLDEIHRIVEARSAEPLRPVAPAEAPRPARADSDATVPTVNLETLSHLEELGSSAVFVEKLIGVYLADNAELVARMEAAVAARGFKEFRAHLHAMKGSSASMGTDRLTRLCTSLGRLSDTELRGQGIALVRLLGQELTAARNELEQYLAERRRSAG